MINLSRRRLIVSGLAATAGASGLAVAARLAQKHGLISPDHGGIYGIGETLTYASQRLLTRHSLAREFADWRLSVDGMVHQPGSFSMADLRSYPSRSHITEIACEEGWSYIAEWTGVPLSHVLQVVGAAQQATHVVYRSIQPDWWESIDMADALHPQTLLAHEMNGRELPVGFGGPLRMRVTRQLGYKSLKYMTSLTVTNNIKQFGKGLGSAEPEGGYAWYAGI